MTSLALQYLGDGEFKTHTHYHAKAADKALVIGEVLNWEQIEPRSQKTHNHYFAALNEAWQNLPETLTIEFPNVEALRKFALIKAGYCTVQKVVCANNREANALVAIAYGLDAFVICEVNLNVVTIYRAKSQSLKAMGKDVFQKSKQDVLEIVSGMIGAQVREAA